jgi:hypothetical protein
MARSSYNPTTGHFELPEDDVELMPEAAQRMRPCQPRGSAPMFDSDGDRHADAAPGSIQRFMPYDGTWHMAPVDWGIEFNAMMRRYEFVPPRR